MSSKGRSYGQLITEHEIFPTGEDPSKGLIKSHTSSSLSCLSEGEATNAHRKAWNEATDCSTKPKEDVRNTSHSKNPLYAYIVD
jgi:hypothetical protein